MALQRGTSFTLDWDTILSSSGEDKQETESQAKTSNVGRLSIFRYMEVEEDDLSHPGMKREDKPKVDFCTDSCYTGQWDSLGMSGFGTYVFPHGVEYEGNFKDGMFHGEGTLTYPMGQKVDGMWEEGVMQKSTFRFTDGLEFHEPWDYCRFPDRRFFVEMNEGLRPAGREFLTNEQPTRIIPEGCYDTGKGFFDAKTKCISGSLTPEETLKKIDVSGDVATKMMNVVGEVIDRPQVQIATESEEEWIVKNCRKAWDEVVGYRPELYEYWTSGKAEELALIQGSEKPSISSSISSSTQVIENEDAEIEEVSVVEEDKPERDDITKIWLIDDD